MQIEAKLSYRRGCTSARLDSEHPLALQLSPMNYRHIYHAGNFADVMKHVVLAWRSST